MEMLRLPESWQGLGTPLSHSSPFSFLKRTSENVPSAPLKLLVTQPSLNETLRKVKSPWHFPKLLKEGDTGTHDDYMVQHCLSVKRDISVPMKETSATRPAVLKVRSLDPLGDPRTLSEVCKVKTIFIIILTFLPFFPTVLTTVQMMKRQWWVKMPLSTKQGSGTKLSNNCSIFFFTTRHLKFF